MTKRNGLPKRLIAGLTAFIAALGCMAFALADGETALYIDGAQVSGSVLQGVIFCDAAEAPKAEELTVSLDGKDVTPKSVNPLSYADPGTTYVILADTDTAVTERALKDMQIICRAVVNAMGASDNAAIVGIDAQLSKEDVSDQKDVLNERIDMLKKSGGTRDLYASMSQAIKLLQSGGEVRARKCLIVMADGLDRDLSGISAMELSAQVVEAGIPVNVIALTYNTKTAERIEAAKTITGFARQSAGGVDVMLKTDGVTAEDAAAKILARNEKTYVLVIDKEDVRAVTEADKAVLRVSFTREGTTAADEREISLAGLPARDATPIPEATAEPIATPQPESEALDAAALVKQLPGWTIYAAIGVFAMIVALVVALVCVSAKKRKHVKTAVTSGEDDVMVRFDASGASAAPDASGIELCIVRIGEKEEICCRMRMTRSLIIGSDMSRAQLRLADDKLLMPVQCRFDWKADGLWASDLSPNGDTLLSGAPIQDGMFVRSGDVMRIGSMDYRVFWEKY